MKMLVAGAVALSMALGGAASAAPCRNAAGKFVSCAAAKPKACRDAKGKFTTCTAVPKSN